MKTRLFLFLVCLVASANSWSQRISGVVENEHGDPLPMVELRAGDQKTKSDNMGFFSLPGLGAMQQVSLEKPGYFSVSYWVNPQADSTLHFVMTRNIQALEEIQVHATRAKTQACGVTLVRATNPLKVRNFGQDIPILLEYTPSVTTTSDAGGGIGYTGIRIRGVDASRINVTINGIPVNDPESHDVYWVNMPDLVSSIENIQIQRGVGSSTNGAAAFGASLNIKTANISTEPTASTDVSVGSFGTYRGTINASTGLVNNRFAFETRLSGIHSDGYIDRASSNLTSYYLGASYLTEKSIWKAIAFSGKEITYQSWYGTPESRISGNVADMNAYADRNYLDSAERANLLNSGRTYNYYTYANQVDHYQQDNYQLHFTHQFSAKLNMTAAAHYTYGRGYYEEYRKQDAFADYGLAPVILGFDTVSTTDLIRRRWLDNDFVGAVTSLNYTASKALQLTWGGSANSYTGRHFGEIIWAQYASNSSIYQRYYDNDSKKNELNSFAKAYYTRGKFELSADLQVRHIDYTFVGMDVVSGVLKEVGQQVSYTFFNPKASVGFKLSNQQHLQAFIGQSHREPVYRDFRESTPDSRPQAEALLDIELSHILNLSKWSITTTLYEMNYKNQLVMTGQINDVGSYIHTNVDKSYRRGIELYARYMGIKHLVLHGGFTLSDNRILRFTEFVDQYYDTLPYYSQGSIVHQRAPLSFSPNLTANFVVEYAPLKGLNIQVLNKFVSRQYLDNTGDLSRSLNPYWFTNIIANYTLEHVWSRRMTFGLQLNNVFNAHYSNNGYTFSYQYNGQSTTENFYYPQAGRNFMLRVSMQF
ncbi:MAG: hypothetical protein RLZZ301_995 [Bacteroidota bacterium]|jgi:iron complex outermembrane receptor protein